MPNNKPQKKLHSSGTSSQAVRQSQIRAIDKAKRENAAAKASGKKPPHKNPDNNMYSQNALNSVTPSLKSIARASMEGRYKKK